MTATQRAPSPPASEADEFEDAHDGLDLTSPTATAPLLTAPKDKPLPASATFGALDDVAGPSGPSAPKPRPAPFDLDHTASVPPSETGDTPMATAPTSPLSPFSPTTPTSSTKPRLAGRGAPPSRPSEARSGQTLEQRLRRARARTRTGGLDAGRRLVDEGEEADDECVSFVRAQLVRLFPDFHALDSGSVEIGDAEGQAPGDGEGEGAPPTFRAELMAMRTEIGVLRGIVAELTAAHPAAAEQVARQIARVDAPSEAAQPKQGSAAEVESAKPEPKEESKESGKPAAAESTKAEPTSETPVSNGTAKDSSKELSATDHATTSSPSAPELDPATLELALSVVRVLDAAAHGPKRTDADVFDHTNLRTLLALAFARPPASSDDLPTDAHAHTHGHGHHHPHHAHKSTHAHDHLNAHEEIEKAHDVAITPEIGTPPSPKTPPCPADDMSDEELDELAELAEEAHGLVS